MAQIFFNILAFFTHEIFYLQLHCPFKINNKNNWERFFGHKKKCFKIKIYCTEGL